MADINLSTTGKKSSSSLLRNIRIDMTPMVDLGFLLITFFIFSTTMSQPTAMKLIMPSEGKPTGSPETNTLTLLLKEDGKVLCYEGFAKDNTSYRTVNINESQDGLRDVIQEKIKRLQQKGIPAEEMIVIIKPTIASNYSLLVAALDEMTINAVKKYAMASLDTDDGKLLAAAH